MEVLETIYQDRNVLKYVFGEVDKVSGLITNTASLERDIFSQLVKYYKTKRGKRSISRIRYLVDREISLAKERFGLQSATRFSDLAVAPDFGESVEYEPKDVLANVSETVVKNIWQIEKIGSLAATDRDKFTLSAWMDGYNDSEISMMLAHRFGGKAESHRKSVQRLKRDCRKLGRAAAI